MSERPRAPWRRMVAAFVASPTGLLSGLAVLVLALLVALGSDGFGAGAITADLAHSSEGPSAAHRLGTDGLGRDILARTFAATRTSIVLALIAVGIAVVAGSLIGGLLAAAGPRVRRLGATVIDTLMSFGDILLAVVVVAIVGVGAKGAVIAVGVAFTPTFARFTYSLVSSVMVREYLQAARVTGVGRRGILSRYVARNVADSMAIVGFTAVGEAVIAMSSLSFLGLGIQSPQFDWGQMLTDGVRNFYLNPYAALAPAVMITLTGLALSLFGDAAARAVNPILWDQRPRLFRRRGRGRAAPAAAEVPHEQVAEPLGGRVVGQ